MIQGGFRVSTTKTKSPVKTVSGPPASEETERVIEAHRAAKHPVPDDLQFLAGIHRRHPPDQHIDQGAYQGLVAAYSSLKETFNLVR